MASRVTKISIVLVISVILFHTRPLPAGVLAQTTDPSLVFPTDEAQPATPDILPLSFSPPAEATNMDDFISATGQAISLTVPLAAFTDSTSSFISLTDANLSSYPQKQIDGQQETLITVNDGQLGIIIEEETFTQTVQLVVPHSSRLQLAPEFANGQKPAGALGNHPAAGPLTRFQLELIDANNKLVTTFRKQVRLVVDMRDYGLDLTNVGGYFYLAYEAADEPGRWIEVPINTHGKNGLISAEVDHFSNWEAGWRPGAWGLEWRAPGVNEFTGRATYQHSFQVPPGRNGTQPDVSLSYSSASLSGAIRQVSLGSVATGWSLSDISITRTGSRPEASNWIHPNSFRLTVNGVGGRLRGVGTENGVSVYRVEDQPQLKVYNYGGRSWHDQLNGNSYWIVMDGSGLTYRLGYSDDAMSVQDAQPLGGEVRREIIAWHVDTATDAFGNQINYNYIRPERSDNWGFWCPWGGNCGWHVWTYNSQITTIRYNFDTRITALPPAHNVQRLQQTATAASRIEFLYHSGEHHLSEIQVFHGSDSWPIRRYLINGTTEPDAHHIDCAGYMPNNPPIPLQTRTRVVNWIEEQGYDSVNNQWVSLPRTTFSYTAYGHYSHLSQSCFRYRYLTSFTNGYGGSTQILAQPEFGGVHPNMGVR